MERGLHNQAAQEGRPQQLGQLQRHHTRPGIDDLDFAASNGCVKNKTSMLTCTFLQIGHPSKNKSPSHEHQQHRRSAIEEVPAFTYLGSSTDKQRVVCRCRRQSKNWQSKNSVSTTHERLEYQNHYTLHQGQALQLQRPICPTLWIRNLEDNKENFKRLREYYGFIGLIKSEKWICGREPTSFQWKRKSGKEDGVDFGTHSGKQTQTSLNNDKRIRGRPRNTCHSPNFFSCRRKYSFC